MNLYEASVYGPDGTLIDGGEFSTHSVGVAWARTVTPVGGRAVVGRSVYLKRRGNLVLAFA